MIIDLHCHTNMSDGALTPNELIDLAIERGVDMLSITDHDTLDAYAHTTTVPSGLKLIPGIELSSRWRKQGIHIVGLNIDLSNEAMVSAVNQQSKVREQRAQEISNRLGRLGFDNCLEGAQRFAHNQIGRPHFAEHLIAIGAVKNANEAFKKYLGAGKVGDIKEHWPDIDTAVQWIRQAGGVAVLAHPSKYKMTRTKLTELISDFKDAGGEAMEVVSGLQIPSVTRDLAKLCSQFDLLASCGSDFHSPDKKWAALGLISNLPETCNPVWDRWS
ncbi:MAG: PHP domain-containing protein [Porticoccaceae bacterium]|jgi:predicted metal-dependent phosphoesterase TrpH|nr:PHP domain-containing protein [Porticoccaceae bacterium]